MSFPHRTIAHIFALKKQDMSGFSFIPPTSVATIPGTHASAAFTTKTSEVFKEDNDIAPIFISERMKYIPWGGDNRMSYLCQLAQYGQSGGHRAHRTSQPTSAVHGSAKPLKENQEVRCRQSHTHARQHVLSHTVLRSSFQRQVVRHQAAHRYR